MAPEKCNALNETTLLTVIMGSYITERPIACFFVVSCYSTVVLFGIRWSFPKITCVMCWNNEKAAETQYAFFKSSNKESDVAE